MIIKASAQLYYSEGQSISCGMERLGMEVSFKEKGKLLRTRIKKVLVSVDTSYISDEPFRELWSYEEFQEIVKDTVADTDVLRRFAMEIVEEYFDEYVAENSRRELADKINNMPKIEIDVEVK